MNEVYPCHQAECLCYIFAGIVSTLSGSTFSRRNRHEFNLL